MKFSIGSFLPSVVKRNKISKRSLEMINPVIGLDLGIPLNFLQNIFTNLHYGFDITTTKIIILQFLIGYYTYGYDRFLDANNDFSSEKKKEEYKLLIQYKDYYKITYPIVFSFICLILLLDENNLVNLPFIILLFSSNYYKQLKTNYPLLKPFYISIMWTLSAVILPCVLFDNNYNILNFPLDYLPVLFNILGLSNLLDIKDIEEDSVNNINTIPVQYGKENSIMFSLFCLFISSILFGLNNNYLKRPLFNSLFEIQNFVLSIKAFLYDKDDI